MNQKNIKWILAICITLFSICNQVKAQPCGVAQNLTVGQQSLIVPILSPLDTALKYEVLFQIDSLSNELKNIYSSEGGKPDAIESYTTLVNNNAWLDLNNSILLSRDLIAADSMVYLNLWKAAKGMAPPLYQPHSLFLRSSAEIASGLLKIADKETDLVRKALYISWATRALDSLATMQLPSGAFPFPDLRTYGDPVFTPIIQNFMISCGIDSVNVLQNGWIVDDKGTGEFKFDAGVIANEYYEAYLYTGNINYKNIAIATGDYLKPLRFNRNYNYNTFVSLGLTRAYQLTNDTSYRERAIDNLRYAVYPGQIPNGRWVDGHNANSRYHSIIIQNVAPTIPIIPATEIYQGQLDTMTYLAVKNMVDYTYSCNAATGYRWLMKSYMLNSSIIPLSLHDSITNLIGRYIHQSDTNANFLDVPTMGEYLELLGLPIGIEDQMELSSFLIFPNPSDGIIHVAMDMKETSTIEIDLLNMNGQFIKTMYRGTIEGGLYSYDFNLNDEGAGFYFLKIKTEYGSFVKKIILLD